MSSQFTKVKETTWIQKEREIEFKIDPISYDGRKTYFKVITQQHVKSAEKWMEDGLFLRSDMPAFAENPTFTGYDIKNGRSAYSYSYYIGSDILPFTGWDYLEVKKFKDVNCLITMYGAYIENVLRAVMKKISTKYLTGNLMDYISLLHLLEICSRKLNHENPFATIVTQTQNWTRDFYPKANVEALNEFPHWFQLGKTGLEDTNNPQQVDRRNSIGEYQDNFAEFVDFVRALFHAFYVEKGWGESWWENDASPTEIPKVPTVKVLGKEFHLKLRDGFRNENRVAVFKMAVNRRRVTMIKGIERILEWVSLHNE